MIYKEKRGTLRVQVVGETPRTVVFYPEGGGFEFRAPKVMFQHDFEEAPPLSCEKERFWFGEGEVFPGYWTGARWNGWAVPYFEKRVLLQTLGDYMVIEMREDFIKVVSPWDPESLETLEPVNVVVDGKPVQVWPGPSGLTWERAPSAPDWMTQPLRSREDGIKFIYALNENGKLFHLEDPVAEIIDPRGDYVFPSNEVPYVTERTEELHHFVGDPCRWALWVGDVTSRFLITWVTGYTIGGSHGVYGANLISPDNGFSIDTVEEVQDLDVGDHLDIREECGKHIHILRLEDRT